MLALVQRVERASVEIDGDCVGQIGKGLLVFFCAERGDADADCDRLAGRLLRLRCFVDAAGKMNLDIRQVEGELLVVSQFTLAADTASGNRPGFGAAAEPGEGRRLYDAFVSVLRTIHPRVSTGRFGADMKVSLVNDGPVTLWLRSASHKLAPAGAGQGQAGSHPDPSAGGQTESNQ